MDEQIGVKQHQSKSKMSGTREREERETKIMFCFSFSTKHASTFRSRALPYECVMERPNACAMREMQTYIFHSQCVDSFVRSFVSSRLHIAHNARGRQIRICFMGRNGSEATCLLPFSLSFFDASIFNYDRRCSIYL